MSKEDLLKFSLGTCSMIAALPMVGINVIEYAKWLKEKNDCCYDSESLKFTCDKLLDEFNRIKKKIRERN